MSAGKVENVTDAGQVKKAEFIKYFGDAPEMRELASREKVADFCRKNPRSFYCFGVPREFPVCDDRGVPEVLLKGTVGGFEKICGTARPGEFFVFQIAVWNPDDAIFNLSYSSDFPLKDFRCISLEGRDSCGKKFVKRLDVSSHRMQVLWFGVQVPNDISGDFKGTLRFRSDYTGDMLVSLELNVSGEVAADFGDSNENGLSRLRWLDSRIGEADTPVFPYLPLTRTGREISWLGHRVVLTESGFPAFLGSSYAKLNTEIGTEEISLLEKEMTFCSVSKGCFRSFQGESLEFVSETPGGIRWRSSGTIGEFRADLNGSLEFDGTFRYSIDVYGADRTHSADFRLDIRHRENTYLVGLNRHGGFCPDRLLWGWNADHWQDGCWIGSLNAGLRIRLCDRESNVPLLNCYYNFSPMSLPDAWHNNGRGGISLDRKEGIVTASHFSGERELLPNHSLNFGFELQVTPFKPVSLEQHWEDRFYHPNMHAITIGSCVDGEEKLFRDLSAKGVRIINLHHAIAQNPFINYPITSKSLSVLQNFVEKAHAHGLKVCLYYTIRELSLQAPEFWAFASMNGEILFPGLGQEARPCTAPQGPHPWLIQNLHTKFLSAWAEVVKNGEAAGILDLSVETTPGSRLENFYLECFRYLLERCPIDGVYLDDSCLSRHGFQRMTRVFHEIRGSHPIINFHAWSPFPFGRGREFGSNSVILRDMAILPYLTHLWLGESFNYEEASPEFYLTEICGIPFGLMGEMLHGGGNPWRGILYAMTARSGWSGNPEVFWNLFDSFDLKHSAMFADFERPELFRFSQDGIHGSLYVNPRGEGLLSVASWRNETTPVKLALNTDLLPASLKLCRKLYAPAIDTIQPEAEFSMDDSVPLEPAKGWLFLLR